jgi:hypothetical protein
MMEDIIKRLQRIAVGMANEEEDAVIGAINEIEWLRGEVKFLKQQVSRLLELRETIDPETIDG